MPASTSLRPSIFTIAVHTVRGYFKERILLVVLIFVFVLMLASYVLAPMAVGAQHKIIVDIGLAAISIFGVLLVVLLGAGAQSREKDSGILSAMLVKPVSRVDFILGKYFGTTITVWVVTFAMAALFLLVMAISRSAFNGTMFIAMYMSILEVALLSAVMTFFSTFTSPLLSAFFSSCVLVSGHLSKDLLNFADQFGGGVFKGVVAVGYYVLPNLSMYNLRQEAVHDLPLMSHYTFSVTVYTAFYAAMLLLFSSLIFRRKDVT